MAQVVPATFQFPPAYTGLAIRYKVLTITRTVYSAFTTSGVVETTIPGTYSVTGGVIAPDDGAYIVVGVSGTDYAEGAIDPA
jgi:hypothetical protein